MTTSGITTLVVHNIFFSHHDGKTPLVDIYPYNGDEKLVSGNDLHARGFEGITNLVNAPDYRSDWYGWGLSPHQGLPESEVGLCKLNGQFRIRDAYKRRVKRFLRQRAREEGLKIKFAF